MTTSDHRLLSWGANSHHQLGQGVKSEQCLIPMAVNLKEDVGPGVGDIKKVTGGAGHSLTLTARGEVYSCGLNSKGQAGFPGTTKHVTKFERIEALKDEVIVDVACGWDSSMAIDDKGNIYGWGSNAYGQLGDARSRLKFTRFYEPRKIPIDELDGAEDPVVKISMGLRHSALVTKSGKVFVAGNGSKCQLGLTDCTNKPIRETHTFTQVPDLFGVKTVACGQHHTMVLTKEGDLYGWGDNKHGQIGFDTGKYPSIERPLKLDNVHVQGSNGDIFTGWTHTALLNGGKVLAWGRNSYGQLGRGESPITGETWVPELVRNIPKLVQLAIGSEHNVGLAENGSIICWGWNEHGNCGNGTDRDLPFPTCPKGQENSRGTLVGTGAGHSFAVVHTYKARDNF